MKVGALALLDSLSQKTGEILEYAQDYSLYLNDEQMHWNPDENEWSIADCLEHLNLYGDYYLPLFQNQITKAKPLVTNGSTLFKSGWFGDYAVNSVKMEDSDDFDKLHALEEFDPVVNGVRNGVLSVFMDQQKVLLDLIKEASKIDLCKSKFKTPGKNWLRLNFGDALRWVIFHNFRHIFQSNQIFKVLRG